MKDILVFISDQHAWLQQGYAGDSVVRTPNLDRIAAAGTAMQNNYTAYPLCVPARMSMMSCQLASKCGAMSNSSALDSNRATFTHSLNAHGYETVLCGRMHFVGPDQRHGFAKRIAGEQTPIFHNRPSLALEHERGIHARTPQGGLACLSAIGGGNSPTLEYDRYVVSHALDYLSHAHEKPQFLCVGTYGPHHPYVAPRELYEYYLSRVNVPSESFTYKEHPAIAGKLLKDTDPDVVRAVRAAYYGLVEFEDTQVGLVYDAFLEYLKRNGREGVFVYVSDHGDHAGYRGYYGKESFYEPSAHTPMIFTGNGILVGQQLQQATSLLDLGPTLCDIVGAQTPPDSDGVSLRSQLEGEAEDPNRMVISEVGGEESHQSGLFSYGQMVKQRNLKFIHYDGFDADDWMFDLDEDPQESVNVIDQYPELAAQMRAELLRSCRPVKEIRTNAAFLKENLQILRQCDFDSDERWRAPECARHYPDPMVKSNLVK